MSASRSSWGCSRRREAPVSVVTRPRRAQRLRVITLSAPTAVGRVSVGRALRLRRTVREFSGRALSIAMVSDLVWAAFGINRTQGPFGLPGRTAASASNSQEIHLYVCRREGTYLYDTGLIAANVYCSRRPSGWRHGFTTAIGRRSPSEWGLVRRSRCCSGRPLGTRPPASRVSDGAARSTRRSSRRCPI